MTKKVTLFCYMFRCSTFTTAPSPPLLWSSRTIMVDIQKEVVRVEMYTQGVRTQREGYDCIQRHNYVTERGGYMTSIHRDSGIRLVYTDQGCDNSHTEANYTDADGAVHKTQYALYKAQLQCMSKTHKRGQREGEKVWDCIVKWKGTIYTPCGMRPFIYERLCKESNFEIAIKWRQSWGTHLSDGRLTRKLLHTHIGSREQIQICITITSSSKLLPLSSVMG